MSRAAWQGAGAAALRCTVGGTGRGAGAFCSAGGSSGAVITGTSNEPACWGGTCYLFWKQKILLLVPLTCISPEH